MSKKELIVVSIGAKHPSGQRCRAGFRFKEHPSVAEVTPEQKADIKADRYLQIHRRLSMAWFKAFNIDHTEKNIEAYADKDPQNWTETAVLAEIVTPVAPDSQVGNVIVPGANAGQGEGDKTADQKKAPVNEFSSKADIVKELEALGLKAGEDFEPAAKRAVLLSIYREKTAAKTSPTS